MDDLFENCKPAASAPVATPGTPALKADGRQSSGDAENIAAEPEHIELAAPLPEEAPIYNETAVMDAAVGHPAENVEEPPLPPLDFQPSAPTLNASASAAVLEEETGTVREPSPGQVELAAPLPEEAPVYNETAVMDAAVGHPAENAEEPPLPPLHFADGETTLVANTPKPAAPAVEEPPKQPQVITVQHLPKKKLLRPASLNLNAYGDTLRSLREMNSLSLDDLAGRTLINKRYLIALEREDYKNLPPPVYIAAYIRKLGNIFDLSEDEIVALAGKVRSMVEYDLPDEMNKVVVSYEQSEENDERLRKILTVIGLSAAALIAAVVIVIMLLFSNSKSNADQRPPEPTPVQESSAAPAGGKFTEQELVRRRPPLTVQPTALPSKRR